MKHTFRILVLFTTLLSASCSNNNAEEAEIDFYGNWFGTFSGDDSGTFSVFIHEDGSVTGDAVSNNLQQTVPLTGQIDASGDLNAVFGSAETNASFTGKFTENTGSGTWNNPTFSESGTWTGSRADTN